MWMYLPFPRNMNPSNKLLSPLVLLSGQMTVELLLSLHSDNNNFKEPNLTINALQILLYERAYTDGNGTSDLKAGTKEVLCLSAVYKGLTVEEKEGNKQLAKIRKKKRRF